MTFLALAGNHLWQSTLFAAAIAVLSLAFRKSAAAVRHGLWLTASLKFLVPFAALAALGGAVGFPAAAPLASPAVADVAIAFDTLSQPFPVLPPPAAGPRTAGPSIPAAIAPIVMAAWIAGTILGVLGYCRQWRRVAAIARAGTRVESGRDVDALRTLERAAGLNRPIAFVTTSSLIEPGVFGIRAPVLLWPVTIAQHLTTAQATTILAHEVAHVRRRDNLAAVMQTAVESIFWFHPLVWWIGARLVDERERACDEHVLLAGGEPRVYAESILTACRVYVEAPSACVAGVTGSDLHRRIERIMAGRAALTLAASSKLLLTAMAVAAVAAPILLGALNAPRLRAQSAAAAGQKLPEFEVASIKPSNPSAGRVAINTNPGGRFGAVNTPLAMLVQFAYRMQPHQVVGGPDWFSSDRFDIVAKGDDAETASQFAADQTDHASRSQLMLRALLADRFKLVVRTETREMPMYTLVMAKSDGRLGEALHRSNTDCSAPTAANAPPATKAGVEPGASTPCGIRLGGLGQMVIGGASMSQIASTLSGLFARTVVDRTGLTGTFDATLAWTPDQSMPGMFMKAGFAPQAVDQNGPSIFTAVQEQLGLKLEAGKGPVKVLVIVSAQRPAAN